MKELVRTNDPVMISWLQTNLADAGIESVIFDQYTSAVEGSIGILPRRIMVIDDDFIAAQRILASAPSERAP